MACPERLYLSKDQIEVAAAMSTLLDELDSQFSGIRGSTLPARSVVPRLDVGQVRGSEVRERLAQAARAGSISAADAQALHGFVSQTAQRLSAP